jgi:outer membrane receptor protein involved in Fe transport
MNFASSRSCAIRLAALLGSTSFMAMAATGAAWAQGQMAQAPAGMPPEQVLITGSLIQGAQAVGVPVTDLRPADFVETGQLALNDVLKSVQSLDIDAEASPTYGGGTLSFLQNVQIHSLGTGSGVETLLLVNGLRFPPQNYSNDTVNPAIIPTIALERVDVLSAGASAVYGSDATAGVINLILRRGYDGAMTQGGVTTATRGGYTQWQFSQLFGKSWDTGNVTASYSIIDSNAMKASERSFYTQDFTPWGLWDNTPRGNAIPGLAHSGNAASPNNAPQGLNANAGTQFCTNCFSIPRGQNGQGLSWSAIAANPGVNNLVNNWTYGDARPQLQTNQGTIVFDQRLTNDFYGLGSISIFADAFYSHQRGKQIYPPSNGEARQVPNTNLTGPTTNPYYPTGVRCVTNPNTPAGCTPTNIRVDYSFALEVPTIINGGETASHWDAGFNLDNLPFDWNGKLVFSMTDDKNFGDATNDINRNNVSAALGNVVPADATVNAASYTKPASIPYLNVFCDPLAFQCNDPKTLAYIVGYRLQHERFKIQESGFNFNGPVYTLPGGPLVLAVAGQTLSEHWTYQQLQNNNTQNTTIITNTVSAASQSSYAIFGQLNIPVFGEGFNFPGVESLYFELGYRYDKYSNLTHPVTTPKIAANWLVGGGLTFRGAWGKSFRVPSFAENDPNGSRVAGINPLGLASNTTDVAILRCASVGGSPSGVAIPGSLTAELNPNCVNDNPLLQGSKTQPGGMSVELSGNGAAAVLRGHGLSPQSLSQWSVGFNYAPSAPLFNGFDLTGLNVDVSWFRLEFRGLIASNAPTQGLNPDDPASRYAYTVMPRPDLPITDPANADFLQLVKDLAALTGRGGFSFDTAAIPAVKFIQDTALTNVGSRSFGGIDFNIRYDFDLGRVGFTDAGALNIGAAGYYQVLDRSRTSAGAPLDDRYQGKESGNRLQRVRYRLGWANENWNITGFANYFGHQAINLDGANLIPLCFFAPGFGPNSCFNGSQYYGPAGTFPNITPATVYFDLSLGYQTGEAPANEYLRNIGVQITVNDLLDKGPPFSVGARGNGAVRAFDNAFSDLGRTVSVVLTKVW